MIYNYNLESISYLSLQNEDCLSWKLGLEVRNVAICHSFNKYNSHSTVTHLLLDVYEN